MRTLILLSGILCTLLFSAAYTSNDIITNPTKIIKGIVLDETGTPVIGANVFSSCNNAATITDIDGAFDLEVPENCLSIEINFTGYNSKTVLLMDGDTKLNILLSPGLMAEEIVVTGLGNRREKRSPSAIVSHDMNKLNAVAPGIIIRGYGLNASEYFNENEQYGQINENKFVNPEDEALSTFSIDIDRASYSNVRRYLDMGQLPPIDAVRIEEMINYFDYDYAEPKGDDPIAINTTLTDCPWNKNHNILHISLQGKKSDTENLPASNLVFLIDVSGSMNDPSKLGLVKSSFKMLVNNLRSTDKVSIVTYAGQAGIALEPTSAKNKTKILNAIDALGAGGSTEGAEGIKTAYRLALENYIKNGNNRVILATDGDFNVGINSDEGLEKLIEKEREKGVFLSILGYGMGNYKDEKMQILAGKGNGNHAYIDNIQEARKVLVHEFGGTLFTIAKDVKLQLEFNPAHVAAYRLIGYENRMLEKEDFNNDQKDAGDIGSGHVVTAIYEIVPTGVESQYVGNVDELKYQTKEKVSARTTVNGELATVKFRYKQPDGKKSKKITVVVKPEVNQLEKLNDDIRFSLAVAEFGLILRESEYLQDGTLTDVINLASSAKGKDEEGYQAEFIRLAKSVKEMKGDLVER